MTGEIPNQSRPTDESGNELPEDMTNLLRVATANQNQSILQIAAEIADANSTIRDLHIEFAEKMARADYDADAMIDQLEYWKPGSRQRVHDAIESAFDDYYPLT